MLSLLRHRDLRAFGSCDSLKLTILFVTVSIQNIKYSLNALICYRLRILCTTSMARLKERQNDRKFLQEARHGFDPITSSAKDSKFLVSYFTFFRLLHLNELFWA